MNFLRDPVIPQYIDIGIIVSPPPKSTLSLYSRIIIVIPPSSLKEIVYHYHLPRHVLFLAKKSRCNCGTETERKNLFSPRY